MAAKIIETKRLILREFSSEDAQFMYDLNLDSEVMKYTGDLPFSSIKESQDFLENYSDYKKNGFGRWVVCLKETDEPIGWCGLKLNEENIVDLGFRFFKKHWGKGYATESAQACLDFGFQTLDISEIIGRAATENGASVRVLEKLGMEFFKSDDCKGIPNAKYFRARK